MIFDGVGALVREHRPTEAAFEKVFVHRNADSALKLGQARSAAICATFSGGVTVHEYAARAVKQAVVGHGGADKAQVQHMVRALLRLPAAPAADEADALAVAICHAHTRSLSVQFATTSRLRVVRR
jgi:crossover junction endodeoxyribonuclease RuvC